MNGSQRAVLWIGLIMTGLNLVLNWSKIKAVIFAGAGSSGVSNANPSSGGISTVPGIPAPSGGGITLPFGGFPITVPLSNVTPNTTTTKLVVMATATKPPNQPGYDIVVTTAFSLIGVGLLSLLAGISDQFGKIVVVLMAGFMIIWLMTNTAFLQKYLG